MRTLEGRVAIVTGGGHGVGRGIALALSGAGARVVICGRTPETLAQVRGEIAARGGEALDVICDITRPEDRDRLIAASLERFGAINILVNNAAMVPHASLLTIGDDTIAAAWETGPLASLHLMRLCHPHLKGDGVIVNVSSGASIANAVPGRGIYAAVKAALNAITRCAAVEWGPDGIRANTIMPVALTEPFERFLANEPDQAQAVVASIPLRRVGDPETDIGSAVVFLCGPESRYLTGATLPLDGGSAYLR
jgi:meso-butanediol dehydrogenase / (S,S)-butanediol dehydrogenase / diacetyl reductase